MKKKLYISDKKPRATKVIRYLVIATVIAVILLSFMKLERKIPVIDMNNTGGNTRTGIIEKRNTLNIAIGAMISPEITRLYYDDLLKNVAEKMGLAIRIFQQRTYSEVNALVKNRTVDLAYVCSGPFVKGHSDFGMELLVVPVINGKTTYNSYIIANRNLKIRSFSELKGKNFVYSDPHSNTGYIYPNFRILDMGYSRKNFFREFFFSYSHDNSIKAVALGQCDGGAVDSLIWHFIDSINPGMTKETKIIEISPPYGIPPFVVHPDLEKEKKEILREIFLTLHKDKKAMRLMKRIHIQKFVKGNLSMYDSVGEMGEKLEKNR